MSSSALDPLGPLLGGRWRKRGHRRHQMRVRAGLEGDHHRLPDREARVDAGALEAPSQAAGGAGRRPPGGDVGSEDEHAPRRRHEPADGVEQRGLSCAVGADEADQFAAVDMHGDAVDRGVATEADRHVLGLQRWAHFSLELSDAGRHRRSAVARRLRLGCRRAVGQSRGLLREPAVGPLQQLVPDAVDDLQQPTWEVHEQHQQADAAGQQPHQIVELLGDQLGNAPNPESPEDGTRH